MTYYLHFLYYFFLSLYDIFFTFCVFLYIKILYIYPKHCQKMYFNEIRDFIFENYYKRIGFSKENSYYSMKRLKIKNLLLLANKLIENICSL